MRAPLISFALLALLILGLGAPNGAAADTVQILVDGAHGGVSEPLPSVPVAAELVATLGAEWPRAGAGFGALRTDDGWLLSRKGSLAELARAGEPTGEPITLPVLIAEDWLAFVWPPDPALLASLVDLQPSAPAPVLRDGLARVSEQVMHLATTGPPPLRPANPTSGEARLHLVHRRADGAEVHLIGRHRGDGARRVAMQTALDQGAIRLAAGNVLEGRSFLPGQALSLQRDLTWRFAQRDGLDVLVPAFSELVAGVAGLRDEATAAGVTLVSSNLMAGDAHVYAPWTRIEAGGRTVLVLGWTPPEALVALPPAERASLRVAGAEAVSAALNAAWLEGPADLVVLVGLGRGLPDIPGVDLALVDFAGNRRRPTMWTAREEALAARALAPPPARDSFATPRMGATSLADIRATFDDSGLTAMQMLVTPVPEDMTPDPAVRAEVQNVRLGVYVEREAVLVPDPERLVRPRAWRSGTLADELDPAGFAMLAGNLMIERTGSDIALLPRLPRPLDIDGDRSELMVDASLAVPDDVVQVALRGSELRALLLGFPFVQAVPGAAPPPLTGAWVVGAQVSRFPKVRGVKLSDGGMILVAVTSQLLDEPAVAALTGKARASRTWSGERWTRRPTPSGAPWSFRKLVHDGLVQLRAEDPTFGEVYSRRAVPLVAELSGRIPGRFALEIDDLRLGISGSLGFRPDTGYEESNETRARLADSFAASGRGRIALSWSDRIGEIEGFLAGDYSSSRQDGVDKTIELVDDLLAGVELQLRLGGAGERLTPVPLSLYTSVVFDSEWSPGIDPDDPEQRLPAQRLLRSGGGVTLGRTGVIREAWLGAFIEADLSVAGGGPSPGISTGVRTEKYWGALRWSNLVDVRAYFATDQDSASDLSLRANLRSDLVLIPMRKLLPGLGVGGFVDALIFRGALPGLNQNPGLHLLVGAELSYSAALRAPVRIR